MNMIRHDYISTDRNMMVVISSLNKAEECIVCNIVRKQKLTVLRATGNKIHRRSCMKISKTRWCPWIFTFLCHTIPFCSSRPLGDSFAAGERLHFRNLVAVALRATRSPQANGYKKITYTILVPSGSPRTGEIL